MNKMLSFFHSARRVASDCSVLKLFLQLLYFQSNPRYECGWILFYNAQSPPVKTLNCCAWQRSGAAAVHLEQRGVSWPFLELMNMSQGWPGPRFLLCFTYSSGTIPTHFEYRRELFLDTSLVINAVVVVTPVWVQKLSDVSCRFLQ